MHPYRPVTVHRGGDVNQLVGATAGALGDNIAVRILYIDIDVRTRFSGFRWHGNAEVSCTGKRELMGVAKSVFRVKSLVRILQHIICGDNSRYKPMGLLLYRLLYSRTLSRN